MAEDAVRSSGDKGAISELYTSCDLLRKGYEVFRSLSPASSVDLIAIRDSRVIFVEVRTASISTKTGKRYTTTNTHVDKVMGVSVVLASVAGPDDILYLEQSGKVIKM